MVEEAAYFLEKDSPDPVQLHRCCSTLLPVMLVHGSAVRDWLKALPQLVPGHGLFVSEH